MGDWPTWQIGLGSFETESPTTPKRRKNHRGKACLLRAASCTSGHRPLLHTPEEAHKAALPLDPLRKCQGWCALELGPTGGHGICSGGFPRPFRCMQSDRGPDYGFNEARPRAGLRGEEDASARLAVGEILSHHHRAETVNSAADPSSWPPPFSSSPWKGQGARRTGCLRGWNMVKPCEFC